MRNPSLWIVGFTWVVAAFVSIGTTGSVAAAEATPDDLKKSLEGLSSDNAEVRDAASQALLQAGPQALSLLLALLDSADPEVCNRAQAVLVRMGQPALIFLEKQASRKAQDLCAQIISKKVQAFLKPQNTYDVEWKAPPIWDEASVLEFATGSIYNNLKVYRFKPEQEAVAVLQIAYDNKRAKGQRLVERKDWPANPDEVVVSRAPLSREAYHILLRELAVISAAQIKPIEVKQFSIQACGGTYVRAWLQAEAKPGLDLQFAAYGGTSWEREAAKPLAAGEAIQQVLGELKFEAQPPTAEEQAWMSALFIREFSRKTEGDGKDIQSRLDSAHEKLLPMLAAAGDASAVPALARILNFEARPETDAKAVKNATWAARAIVALLGQRQPEKAIEDEDRDALLTEARALYKEYAAKAGHPEGK